MWCRGCGCEEVGVWGGGCVGRWVCGEVGVVVTGGYGCDK